MRFWDSLAVVVAMTLSFEAWPADRQEVVLPVTESVDGTSQPALTVRWWKWAASFEAADSPISDETGERCGAGQEGAVWFLAGTYGSNVRRRACHVPAGKYLFFPLVNYVVTPSVDMFCKDSRALAERMTDNVMGLFAELDGKALPSLNEHRVASGVCFNLAERAKGAPDIDPSASNGYWLLLRPLAKGRHILRFGGSLPSLRQELVYTLDVD